jgi:hypothetical protein
MRNGAIRFQPLCISAARQNITGYFTLKVSTEQRHHTHLAKIQFAGFYRRTGQYFTAAKKF